MVTNCVYTKAFHLFIIFRVVPDVWLAGYPAFYDIWIPGGYPVSLAGYPAKYQVPISKYKIVDILGNGNFYRKYRELKEKRRKKDSILLIKSK